MCASGDGETGGDTLDTKTASGDARIDSLLEFWFDGDPADEHGRKALSKRWFAATPEQDRELKTRFGALAEAAARDELDSWTATPRGRLALIVLLDQLPRSLHRGTAAAFAQDSKALGLCLDGLEQHLDETLTPLQRLFFCMPLQHSESRTIQALAVETFGKLADAGAQEAVAGMLRGAADFALQHKKIVDRFGRFPHRNKALGRESTQEELDFLASGGPSFGQ